LEAIAVHRCALGDTAAAKKILRDVLAFPDTTRKIHSLRAIASALPRACESEFREVAVAVRRASAGMKRGKDKAEAVQALALFGDTCRTRDDQMALEATIAEAMTLAWSIEHDAFRPIAIAKTGALLASAGRRAEATDAFAEALSLVEKVWIRNRALVLVEIASQQARCGDYAEGRRSVSLIDDPRQAVRALCCSASFCLTGGDPEGCRSSLAAAGEIASKIKEPQLQAEALHRIADSQAATGDRAGALSTLGRAAEAAAAIEGIPFHRGPFLRMTGTRQAALGALEEAKHTAELIGDGLLQRSMTLAAIARQLGEQGDIHGLLGLLDRGSCPKYALFPTYPPCRECLTPLITVRCVPM